jgi:multidrug transporter EmrE-like cation transporter
MQRIFMFNLNYIFILCAVAVIAFGQVAFKYAALQLRVDAARSYYDLLRDNLLPIGLVLLALALYLISTVAWVQALRTVPLSVAFMFNSLAFVVVPTAAFLLFGEKMPAYFVPGLLMIVGGIFLITR